MHEEFVHVSMANQWHTEEWSYGFYVLTSHTAYEMQGVTPRVLQVSGLHSTNASVLVNCSVIYLCCSQAIQPPFSPMETDLPPTPQFFKLDQETRSGSDQGPANSWVGTTESWRWAPRGVTGTVTKVPSNKSMAC